jgi:hypothetical protein
VLGDTNTVTGEKQGGQYTSDCVQYSLYGTKITQNIRNVDSGILTCRSGNSDRHQGDQNSFLTRNNLVASADEFCNGIESNNYVFGLDGPST